MSIGDIICYSENLRRVAISITISAMGIIVNKREEKTELQQRITAELREKAARQGRDAPEIDAPEYDMEKSAYLKDYETASVPGWVWVGGLIVAATAALFVAIMIRQ
jgi:hypothetical protein